MIQTPRDVVATTPIEMCGSERSAVHGRLRRRAGDHSGFVSRFFEEKREPVILHVKGAVEEGSPRWPRAAAAAA